MNWPKLRLRLRFLLLIFPLLFVFSYEWPPAGDEAYQLRAIIGDEQFDFLVWESQAFVAKANGLLVGGQEYMTAAEQKEIVLAFMALLVEIQQLEAEIAQIFVDPEVADPQVQSRDYQAQLTAKRASLQEIQPLAEAIMQDQVAAVLAEEGFVVAGISLAAGDDAHDPIAVDVDCLAPRPH